MYPSKFPGNWPTLHMFSLLLLALCCAHTAIASTPFHTGWQLQSSAAFASPTGGATISKGSFDAHTWLDLQGEGFPATVLAALASNGTAPKDDFYLPLYHGTNLNETEASLFDLPWWYRVPLSEQVVEGVVNTSNRAVFTFLGLNYRANGEF